MKNIFMRILPTFLRRRVSRDDLSGMETVSEGWNTYAGQHEKQSGTDLDVRLGDEWNKPEVIGVEVPADRIVSHLDEKIFKSFLGSSKVILEIGSGGGRFTEVLLPKCEKLIASDTSPAMLSLLKKRFGTTAKIEYVLLDGQGLGSIPDQAVDAVFSYGVFVHLQHWDIYNYLMEVRRILKPGGKAIIQHANTFSALGWNKFNHDLKHSLNRHKLSWSFTLMTPEIMRAFSHQAGLVLEDCVTDLVKRDGISLLRKSNP